MLYFLRIDKIRSNRLVNFGCLSKGKYMNLCRILKIVNG